MQMIDQGEQDDKIIGVHADDPEYKEYQDISELPKHRLLEIRRYIVFHIMYTLSSDNTCDTYNPPVSKACRNQELCYADSLKTTRKTRTKRSK